jgi:hypothetical protein
VLGIAEGLNPKLIRIKLEAYARPQAIQRPAKSTSRAKTNTPARQAAQVVPGREGHGAQA